MELEYESTTVSASGWLDAMNDRGFDVTTFVVLGPLEFFLVNPSAEEESKWFEGIAKRSRTKWMNENPA